MRRGTGEVLLPTCGVRPSIRPRDPVGWVVAGGMAVVLTATAWIRHRNGWSGALDLGIFDQGVWLLSRGLEPDVTVNGRNLFADHLSPVLLLFAPLYRLVATPTWLFAGQAIGIAVGLPASRQLAREHGVPVTPVTIAYVLSGPLLAAALFDFHPSTMAVGPLLWLLVAVRAERRVPVVLAAVAVVTCRADLGWMVAATAIVAPRQHRTVLVGVGLLGVALGYGLPATLGAEGTFEVHYGHIGDSPSDVLTHPWQLAQGFSLLDAQTIGLWLMSAGLLTVLAPRWMAATLVAALPLLLSRWPGTEERFFHYGAPMVPFVLGGAIAAAAGVNRVRAAQVLLLGAAASAAFCSPLLPTAPRANRIWQFAHSHYGESLSTALAAVDEDEPVTATEAVVPHLSHRRLVFGYPLPFRPVALGALYGHADPQTAARIRIVIVDRGIQEEIEALGFEVEPIGAGLIIGRR